MNKLLASLLTASLSVGFAQTLPFNFESATAGMQGYDGATFTIVPNPSLVGNSSSNVAKIIKVNLNNQWAGGRIAGVTSLNFTTAETSILSMDVYTTQPVGTVIKVKLEAPYTSEVDAITTASGAWQTLLFDFGIPAPSGSANLIIMPQPFTNGGGTTFYFDNIEQISGSIATPLSGLPITFESGTNTDHFFSFESAQLTVVPNPYVGAANTSATVAKIVRHLGAPFGGSKITFTSPIDFTVNTEITMKVWTSAPIGTNVTLKTEKPFWGVERSVQTTKTSEWETLSFDFAGSLSDMPTLVFLFDFVAGSSNVGNGSANSTFYFDDVKYANVALETAQIEPLKGFRLFPNPTVDQWTISNSTQSDFSVCLYDLQGKQLRAAQGTGLSTLTINASDLPAGVYALRITSGDQSQMQRLVKN